VPLPAPWGAATPRRHLAAEKRFTLLEESRARLLFKSLLPLTRLAASSKAGDPLAPDRIVLLLLLLTPRKLKIFFNGYTTAFLLIPGEDEHIQDSGSDQQSWNFFGFQENRLDNNLGLRNAGR
jgi:hypothetical protein